MCACRPSLTSESDGLRLSPGSHVSDLIFSLHDTTFQSFCQGCGDKGLNASNHSPLKGIYNDNAHTHTHVRTLHCSVHDMALLRFFLDAYYPARAPRNASDSITHRVAERKTDKSITPSNKCFHGRNEIADHVTFNSVSCH